MFPAIAHFWHLRQSQGREAALECDEILKGLSSLNFNDKQRDVFEKHHLGTGQWLLKTDEFQQWFKENRTSPPGTDLTLSATGRGFVSLCYIYYHDS